MKRLATSCLPKRIQVWHKNVHFTGKEKTRKKEDANSKVTDRLDIVSPLERLNQHGRLFCMKNCRRWLIPSKEKFQGFEQSIGESFELKKKTGCYTSPWYSRSVQRVIFFNSSQTLKFWCRRHLWCHCENIHTIDNTVYTKYICIKGLSR